MSTPRPPEPTKCPKCGAWAAAIVCPICKEPRPAPVFLHPAMSHAQKLETGRRIGLTVRQARREFARPTEPEAA